MSARIVLSCLGSYGDLYPYIGLALELKTRGHRPLMATSEFYRPIVEREGLEFHPVRPDVDPADTALLARVMEPTRGSEVVVREIAVPAVRDAYADLLSAARGADLIVTHPIAFAGPLVAGTLGIPWVSTALAPLSFFSPYDFPAMPNAAPLVHVTRLSPWFARAFLLVARTITSPWTKPIDAFRAELGLPASGSPLFEGQFSPYATLALYSRVLGEPQRDWPVNTHVTGFVFYGHSSLPADLAAFLDAGDPPIVFTLGSSAVGAAGTFYEESAKAATAIGRRAVLLVGAHAANRPSRPNDDVMAVEYAPHDLLFQRAAIVVHHGGVGTTGQALRSGHPMLVVPHAHDQPDNAYRLTNLGVARTLDARRYAAPRVAGELRALLDTASYRTRAAAIGRTVASERGTEAACDVLADVVARHRGGREC